MSKPESPKISLKLLVDRNSNKVIFGEAGKDFVDFLFHFISLPVGTVVKLLSADKMIGSIGKIYESIEAMDPNYMEPNFNKQHVLNPKLSSTTSFGDHTPQLLGYTADDVPNDMKVFYTCTRIGCTQSYVSNDLNTVCPQCSRPMFRQLTYVDSAGNQQSVKAEKGSRGYVKGLAKYMVMDNLMVKPMSTICSITLLRTFKVKDLAAIETLEVSIGTEEAVDLLKTSLLTDEVLTSLFLGKKTKRKLK